MKVDKQSVRTRILELLREPQSGLITRIAEEFEISKESARHYVNALVSDGIIEAEGKTQARLYRLRVLESESSKYPLHDLKEDVVWRERFLPVFGAFPENVRTIWQYGITEMVNNAIDHSGSTSVVVGYSRNALYTDAWVVDSGEGIFSKIQKAFGFYDPRESLLELAKGKLTTEPRTHTGEGIFFASKLFDTFVISSGSLQFGHVGGYRENYLLESKGPVVGTQVLLRLDNASSATTKAVFDEYAGPEEYTFSKTIVPVRLAAYEGESLVSRSQAKRLSQRFERFQNVILDFDGVADIGQAFADELFRVFALAHPQVALTPINMSDAVKDMVARARSHT